MHASFQHCCSPHGPPQWGGAGRGAGPSSSTAQPMDLLPAIYDHSHDEAMVNTINVPRHQAPSPWCLTALNEVDMVVAHTQVCLHMLCHVAPMEFHSPLPASPPLPMQNANKATASTTYHSNQEGPKVSSKG